jgi:hypothetical protein
VVSYLDRHPEALLKDLTLEALIKAKRGLGPNDAPPELRKVAMAIIGIPRVRLIKHEVIADCGSVEIRFPDGVTERDE